VLNVCECVCVCVRECECVCVCVYKVPLRASRGLLFLLGLVFLCVRVFVGSHFARSVICSNAHSILPHNFAYFPRPPHHSTCALPSSLPSFRIDSVAHSVLVLLVLVLLVLVLLVLVLLVC